MYSLCNTLGTRRGSQTLCLLCVAGSSSLTYNTPSHTDQPPRLAAKEGKTVFTCPKKKESFTTAAVVAVDRIVIGPMVALAVGIAGTAMAMILLVAVILVDTMVLLADMIWCRQRLRWDKEWLG